jgi:preprotein translocase subunit YajC
MSLHLAWFLWQGQGGGLGLIGLLPFVLIFVLFYFMIIVPQRKRQREMQAMLEALKVGDKVVTTGGICGTITIVREDKRTLQLRIAENPAVKIDVLRSAIAGLQETPEEKK